MAPGVVQNLGFLGKTSYPKVQADSRQLGIEVLDKLWTIGALHL